MKVLVTGSNGFCGKHLTRLLANEGYEVHSTGVSHHPAERYHDLPDCTRTEPLARILGEVRPHYVFHLAGVSFEGDPQIVYQVNLQYAVALLNAMEETGLKDSPVLLVGTAQEYGMVTQHQLPITEDFPPQPYTHYGISKLAQTLVGLRASQSGQQVAIVRPFNIIGPGMPRHLVLQNIADQFVKMIREGAPRHVSIGNVSSARDFIDVRDAVKIFSQIVQKPEARGQIVNICAGRSISVRELISKCSAYTGIRVDIREEQSRMRRRDVPDHYGSTEKLRRILGWVPADTIDGVIKNIFDHILS